VADYDVIYRALADFADLTAKAASARQTLKDLQQAAREESSEETEGAVKAAAAHDADTAAIKRQRDAMVELAATAKAANKETAFGGRDSMQAHLSDLDAERQKEDLLNRTRWGGFSNPQSWEAWQQQVYQHTILRNKEARQGYATPDQYLSYLDQERSRTTAQTEAIKGRAAAMATEAQALQAHNDALRQTHESAGTLGTTGSQNIQGWTTALAGVPTDVTTRVRFADDDALREMEHYRQGLAGAPSQIVTTARLDLGTYLSDVARLKRMAALAGQTEPALPSLAQYARTGPYEAGPSGFTAEGMAALRSGVAGYQPPRPLSQAEISQAQGGVSAYLPPGSRYPGWVPPPPPSFPPEVPYEPVAGPQEVATGQRFLTQFPPEVYSGSGYIPRPARYRPPPPVWSGSARPMTPEGAPILSTQPLSSFGPEVGIRGKQTALEDVASIKSALHDLSQQIANPKVEVSAGRTVDQLATINFAMRRLQQDYKGTGLQPAGYSDLQRQFAAVQSQAERSFDSISMRGSRSADSISARWSALKGSIADVFHAMAASADDAAQHTEQTFATAGERISGAFRGVTASGLGDVFKNLALAASTAGSQVIGSLGPMIATFTVLIQLLPALVAGFGALATVFAAMPETVAAVATAMATLKEAVDPVVQALSAYAAVLQATEAAAANPLQTSMQLAQMQNQLSNAYYEVSQAAYEAMETQVQDAHAVSDAQYSLSQAVVQAANAQVVAAHAVYDAQFQVSQANFQQSIQQVESAMSVADAQHSLADAVFATGQAQYQLDIAWQTASEDLANLMIQVDYASVNLRGAQLALEQAQQNYATTMANSNATALDRAQAAYQIQQAEEALAEQEQQNKDTETQLADVRKYGASQVFGVTQAEHALSDAQFQQAQAAKEMVVTEREAANAQITAAHAVEDAVFSLQQAYFQQHETAITGAHSVADAQYELSQSQIQQGEGFVTSSHDQQQAAFELQQSIDQMALGLPSVASAEENLATAMYRLGPAARTAVLDLEPLAKWFVTNKSIGQAFFAQMDPSLSHISVILRPVAAYLVGMATALGAAAGQALTWFERLTTSPAWKILTSGAISVIRNLADAVGHVVDGFTKLAIVATPFTEWLTRGIDHLADRFDKWATNADKAGSNFRRWLTDVKPALDDIGGVIKAIVDGFSIIAGGPMGSPGSLSALRTFESLMKELSTTILPAFFTMAHALSSPQMAAALIQLFGALSKVLLVIVETPGFQLGFNLAIRLFTDLLGIFDRIISIRIVGNILGAVAGSVIALGAAFAVMKYTGILAMINNLKTLTTWAQNAYKWLARVFGLEDANKDTSGGEGTPASPTTGTAGQAFYDKIVEAGETFKSTVTQAGAETADELETGGSEASTSIVTGADEARAAEAEGGVAGGASAGEGGLLGGILAKLGLSAGVSSPFGWGLIAGAIIRALGDRLAPKGTQAGTYSNIIQNSGWGGPTVSAGAGYIGWLAANKDFQAFALAVGNWFTQTLPHAWGVSVNAVTSAWNTVNTGWLNDVQDPVENFFVNLIPDWLGASGSGWSGLWDKINTGWVNDVQTPVEHFFGSLIPDWLGAAGTGWSGLWGKIKTGWGNDVLDPVEHFFGSLLPDWLGAANKGWDGLFGNIQRWWVTTFPHAMEDAFKTSTNWVITNVINKVIGYINDVTHVVGVPSIKKVQLLAEGGHVGSVGGAGDSDSVHAMLTPGEYVIRKPARMAIDARLGPDFLRSLNSVQGYAQGGVVGGDTSGGGSSNPLTGILSDIGGFLGSAGTKVESLIGGGLKSVENLLGQGAETLFNKMWSVTVQPLANRVFGTGSPSALGAVGEDILSDIKKGIDTYLSGTGSGPVPKGLTRPVSSAQVSAEEAYARSQFGRYGWPVTQMPYLIDNWNLESGWNPLADNPSSGAYGIPQALPASKMGALANPPISSYVAQIDWGLNYIKGRYGTPEASDAHEHEFHWYYTGGDVISAAKEASSNVRYREAMLLGAKLATNWDPSYAKDGKRFGAWAIDKTIDPTVTEAHAKNPYWAARYMLPRFEKGVEHYGWARQPQDAAAAAAMAEAAASFYGSDGAGAVNQAWGDVLQALGIKTQASAPASGSGTGKPGGLSAATLWGQYVPQLKAAVLAERHAFDVLYGAGPGTHWADKSVDGVKRGSADWLRWYAMDLILNQEKQFTLSDSSSSYYSKIAAQLASPTAIQPGWWSGMLAGTDNLAAWESGAKMPPRSVWSEFEHTGIWPKLPKGWRVGDIQPSIAMFQKHQRTAWDKEHDALLDVGKITAEAEAAWKELYGPGGSLVPVTVTPPGGGTPGPGTPPAGSYTAAPDYTSAILAAAGAGGPAVPAYAGGGSVGDVAAMFSGFQAGGSVPDYPDMTPAMAQPGATAAPRGISEAAQASGAGEHIGMQFNGGINIHNPVPERASDSIAHSVNRLSFLHGRGVA
jgi:hypothetical protein